MSLSRYLRCHRRIGGGLGAKSRAPMVSKSMESRVTTSHSPGTNSLGFGSASITRRRS